MQLSILERGVTDMRARKGYMHRGLGAKPIGSEYEKIGISKPLFMQSLRTLESHGLLNINTTSMREQDQTHFISNFGE